MAWRVDTHSYFDLAPVGPRFGEKSSLSFDARQNSITSASKGDEKAITFGGDLVPIVARPRLTEDLAVPLEDVHIAIAEQAHETSGPFDVREHKGDDARGQIHRGGDHPSSLPHIGSMWEGQIEPSRNNRRLLLSKLLLGVPYTGRSVPANTCQANAVLAKRLNQM